MNIIKSLITAILFYTVSNAQIGISIGTGTIQNFDGFAGTLATMPANWNYTWTDFTPGGFYTRSGSYNNSNSIYALRDSLSSTNISIGGKMGASEGPFYLTVFLRNVGTEAITQFTIDWNVEQYSQGSRATTISFSWSTDNITFNQNNASGSGLTAATAVTGPDGNLGAILTTAKNLTITQNIPVNGDIYIRFTWTTGLGSGNNGHIGIDDFSIPDAGVLPVELSSFSAIVLENSVKLNWRTETEVSNYGFEIQRAESNFEFRNSNFEKIGFVRGQGNSNSPKDYSFIDQNVSGGKYFYRLKQIDTDGKFEYSKVIEVDLGSPAKFELSQNYPNPFNPSTTIKYSLPESGNVRLSIYNLLGEKVTDLINEFQEAGIHTINFNASELNNGVYVYKIESNGIIQSRKMILVK